MSLHSAVLPVPGRPEIYNVDDFTLAASAEPKKEPRNCVMWSRSRWRPAMDVVLLHVARRRPRARMCKGMREEGGLSGVSRLRPDRAVEGVSCKLVVAVRRRAAVR